MKAKIITSEIKYLMEKDRCWYFFNVQKEHVLESVKKIGKVINNIHNRGYSDLNDLVIITNELEIIENQMPKKEE